ncbi:MAG: hypothetical protein GXO60_08370 [Epsilonproteobacteria bacterium]|nr:hypothetical protein [Campylobacterota bacterium]
MEYKKVLKRIKKEIIAREKSSKKTVIKEINIEFDTIDYCLCTDSNHQFKKLYPTEYEAEKRAKFLYDEQGILLIAYPCPYSSGWHLTKG